MRHERPTSTATDLTILFVGCMIAVGLSSIVVSTASDSNQQGIAGFVIGVVAVLSFIALLFTAVPYLFYYKD